MRILKALTLAAAMTVGVATVSNTFAADKKVEKKCDKDGKECKEGDNCKPENCKK